MSTVAALLKALGEAEFDRHAAEVRRAEVSARMRLRALSGEDVRELVLAMDEAAQECALAQLHYLEVARMVFEEVHRRSGSSDA